MAGRRQRIATGMLLALLSGGIGGEAQSPVQQYRVVQVFRIESTQSQGSAGVYAEAPQTTVVEGRVQLLLEQQAGDEVGQATWRFLEVDVEGPRTTPAEAGNPDVERALRLGLEWMRQLKGEKFSGAAGDLPAVPLGEADPACLTDWLHWAQTGSFAGVDGDPLRTVRAEASGCGPLRYEIHWLRSEFLRTACHVQQARWIAPVTSALESLSPALAAQGVQARTRFAAQSLEWVSQTDPTLIYAERSAARETFWDMSRVQNPELRDLVFRLRLSVQVRVERLP